MKDPQDPLRLALIEKIKGAGLETLTYFEPDELIILAKDNGINIEDPMKTRLERLCDQTKSDTKELEARLRTEPIESIDDVLAQDQGDDIPIDFVDEDRLAEGSQSGFSELEDSWFHQRG